MLGLDVIEDAIIAVLAPLKATHGVRLVGPYDGELDQVEKIGQRLTTTPAILVSFNGSVDNDTGGQRAFEVMQWTVLVATSDQASAANARRASYALLRAVRAQIGARVLLPGLMAAVTEGTEALVMRAGLVVYAIGFEITQPYLK